MQRGGFGFQQQSCSAVYQEAEQQSYVMHQQESSYSKNQYHNQFSGMEIMPIAILCIDPRPLKQQQQYKFGGNQSTLLQNGGWIGQDMQQNGWYDQSRANSGGKRFNAESESYHHEVHVPQVRVQEIMRYEHSSWGGNNCGDNFNRKPNRYYGAPACVPHGL